MTIGSMFFTGGGQPARFSNAFAGYVAEIGAYQREHGLPTTTALHKYRPPLTHPRTSDAAYDAMLVEQLLGWAPDVIVLGGHSWGVWRALRVARLLAKDFSRDVHSFISVDGVGRNPLGSTLSVPCSVRNLWSWRQRGAISGSELAISKFTRPVVNVTVNRTHAKMDELPAVRETILRLATAA